MVPPVRFKEAALHEHLQSGVKTQGESLPRSLCCPRTQYYFLLRATSESSREAEESPPVPTIALRSLEALGPSGSISEIRSLGPQPCPVSPPTPDPGSAAGSAGQAGGPGGPEEDAAAAVPGRASAAPLCQLHGGRGPRERPAEGGGHPPRQREPQLLVRPVGGAVWMRGRVGRIQSLGGLKSI